MQNMIFGHKTSFDEVMKAIQLLEDDINQLSA